VSEANALIKAVGQLKSAHVIANFPAAKDVNFRPNTASVPQIAFFVSLYNE
jgi:hypothetical protein